MQKEPHVHVELVRRNFHSLMGKGVPQDALEKAIGFSVEDLKDDELKIPLWNNIKMLRKGIEFFGPDMGIEMGAAATPEILGVLGHIMKNCSNLGEAASQFVRFQNLYFAVSRFKIMVDDGHIMIIHSLDYPLTEEDKRLVTEMNLAVCVSAGRKLAGVDFAPEEMHFSFGKPSYIEAYKRHFRCPLKFNRKEDTIIIDTALAQKTIPGSYSYVKNILADYSERRLADMESGTPFQNEVKKRIAVSLPKGIVDINRISEQLNISRWTLTRNLKKEGTTFKGVLAALRRELALNYLEDKKRSIFEIAFLLGYSEASAFQRAFKSWTGKNPHEYRKMDKEE